MTIDSHLVDQLADDAARRAGEIEDVGELPADLLGVALDAGLLRLGLPMRWGGHDASPVDSFRVILRLAIGDGSTGWLVGAATAFHDNIAAGADPELQDRFFSDRSAFLAGGVNGDGVARRVPDGSRCRAAGGSRPGAVPRPGSAGSVRSRAAHHRPPRRCSGS
jgi:hypothetical protein